MSEREELAKRRLLERFEIAERRLQHAKGRAQQAEREVDARYAERNAAYEKCMAAGVSPFEGEII